MNILVLCDQFTAGGMEKHIATYWKALRDSHRFWFCITNYQSTGLLDDSRVCTGFHFTFDATLDELRRDTDRLIGLIREYKIDVIHVHPWFALYPAYFAAAKTGVKLVYTYHIHHSLTYNGNLYDELFMEEIFTGAVSHVFCVGTQGLSVLDSMHVSRASFLPNPIDPDSVPPAETADTRTWALVTRLDADKAPSAALLISMLPELEIDALDIYGDGDRFDEIRALAEQSEKPVRMMGYRNEIGDCLAHGYAGAIGTDRCAMEPLAQGLPVLLLGYGKVCGVIDSSLYERAAQLNFVAESLPDLPAERLNEQLRAVYAEPERFRFRTRVLESFGAPALAAEYIAILDRLPSAAPPYAAALYDLLMELPPETPFHNSEPVFRILRDTLLGQTRNLYLKTQLLQNRLTERKREETAYQLRLAWNDMHERHLATQAALDGEIRLRQEQLQQAQNRLEELANQISGLTAAQQALHEQAEALQSANTELTTRLNTLTLGYLLRQWFRWKILRPLKRLFGKGD